MIGVGPCFEQKLRDEWMRHLRRMEERLVTLVFERNTELEQEAKRPRPALEKRFDERKVDLESESSLKFSCDSNDGVGNQ